MPLQRCSSEGTEGSQPWQQHLQRGDSAESLLETVPDAPELKAQPQAQPSKALDKNVANSENLSVVQGGKAILGRCQA